MKSYCKYIGLMLLPLFAVACDDGASKNYIDMPRPDDELKLTANIDTLVLSADQGNETVLTFNWNTVEAPSETAGVKYLFRMGVADTKFAQATEFMEVPECQVNYGAEDLNDLIASWGIAPKNAAEYEVQVVAQFPDEVKYHMPMLSEMRVVVTTFAPESKPAYMQNNAIDPGYNPHIAFSDGADMTEIILGKMYSWTGWFEKAEGVYVSFSKDGNGESIVAAGNGCAISESAPSASEKFFPPKDGYYTFTVNTKTKEAKWDICVPWPRVYAVGQGLPAGDWNINGPDQLTQDPANPEIFIFDGNIAEGGGEFKMYYQTGSWGNDALMPNEAHKYFEDGVPTKLYLIPGASPDNKFHFPSPGHWYMEVNVNLMTVTATKK